jgi:imidazolonepropionase-like amidohydrolase
MRKAVGWMSLFVVLAYLGIPVLWGEERNILFKNANIITVEGETIEGGDILLKGSKIAKIGKDLKGNAQTQIVDLDGKWVMPGIIDSHSHIAIEGGVNEGGNLITAEVDIKDVIWPEDMNIFYALTGGVTTIHTMHGSANSIGGRGIVLKLRWGKRAEEMIFGGAPPTLKWALGENPKQSNVVLPGPSRYPNTRMGVEASIRREFEKAKDYMRVWEEHETAVLTAKKKKKPAPLPPKKDYRLEVIADTLKGKYWIRCHAYQAEEMLSIMKLCKEYGVKLVCFEHGLEGYRITNELVEYGVAVSTFADFWAYKWEAFKTMPHAVALMAKRGVLTAVNSDDAERMRRLFHDAAKAMRYGGLSEIEAFKTITLNPAIIMGIDKWTGSLAEGKDADLAIFNRHPFDPYTVCEMTVVDGEILFDRTQYLEERKKAEEDQKKKEEEKKDPGKKNPEGEVWP